MSARPEAGVCGFLTHSKHNPSVLKAPDCQEGMAISNILFPSAISTSESCFEELRWQIQVLQSLKFIEFWELMKKLAKNSLTCKFYKNI